MEATVTKVAGVGRSATLTLRLKESGKTVTKEGGEVELAAKSSLEGVSDMTSLDDLTEATVLSTLRARYSRQEIYTNVGGILVAVNPYEVLSDETYGEASMFAYGGADVAFTGCQPHPYLLAESALRALDRDRESQSFVISGESGSGKTESCKYILRYLSYRSKRRFEHSVSHSASDARSNALEESVLLSNPILEAFGNAKTSRNDNSSRWGKYTQVYVQPSSGAIEKVGITAYLLEKVRVIERMTGERNYHVFYQLVAALASGSVQRNASTKYVGVKATDHAVLRDASGQVKVPKDVLDVDAVKATQEAMKALAVDETSAFVALAAVIHLGDILFVVSDTNDVEDSGAAVGKDDLSKVAGAPAALSAAAAALGVDPKELEEALISRRVASVRVPRSCAEAEVAKQAFAKALYSRLFEWVLRRVNHSLKAMTGDQPQKMTKEMFLGSENEREESLTIGLLDIFGFEAFATNSIEQLLINYANERLLQEFNKQVFEAATKEYQAENVDVGDLTYHDNSALLRMLENPRDGVFATLNSECVRRDGSDLNFLSTLLKVHGLSNGAAPGPAKKQSNAGGEKQTVSGLFVPKLTRSSTQAERDSAGTVFGVAHFAADVIYNVNGFVEKNRDRLPDEICALVATSDQPSIATLFADVDDGDESAQNTSPRPSGSGTASGAGSKKKSTRYVAASFAESLTQLTQLLDATSQSFVRCIKPNHKMMARKFEGAVVLDQLRCMGMLELVEARRRGYARRIEHFTFVSRYALLLDDGSEDSKKEEYSYSAALMSMLAGPSKPAEDVDNDVTHQWEAKGGSPAISREFISALKAKKALANPASFDAAHAVGKTKVFLKKDAVDQLESAREERLKRDVLLALGEATEARDVMQLELTLRIADELRLGESEEARLARSTLTDERAFQDIYAAVVELCDEKKSGAVDVAFQTHSIPLAGEGDLSAARSASTKKKGSENLPFSSGQWFAGSQWSVYVHDVSRVARTARFGDRTLASLTEDVTPENLAAANAFVSAARAEVKKYAPQANDEEARPPPVDSLKRLADRVQKMAANAEKRMHVATALRALRSAVAAKNLVGIKSALKTLDALPSDQAETMMTDKDDDTITAARALAKQLEALAVLEKDTSRLSKDTSSSSLTKKFVAKKDAAEQVAKLEAEIATVDQLSAASHDPKLVENSRKLAKKLSDLLAEKAPKKKAVAAAAVTTAAAATAVAATAAAPPAKEAVPTPEEIAVKERKLAREKRLQEAALEGEKAESSTNERDDGPIMPIFGGEMQGMTSEEKKSIAAEEAKRVSSGAVLFCDIPWSARLDALRQGHRVLKMSSTSSVQGADWKLLRLDTPLNSNGKPLMASDPTFKDPSIRSASFLTWPSNTLLRRGSRKLAITSITGVNVGTNARQWCTMVPTEWHYMTLTTPDRTYDFGFENSSIMLLWVNTLQRIIFPDWIKQCEAGEMSELFKGAISDAQHRFYRSARAGASASDLFKPSLPELCPVLYPLASRLEAVCAQLGVSFAARAERSQKFCMWTAVAVLEAPVSRDAAIPAMRAVLSDLGFYAEGRFACSAGFYDENGLAHTLAKDAIASSSVANQRNAPPPSGMLVIRAQHAKTGKVSVLKIKKGTKMASVFEAHAKHKGLRTQALSVVKQNGE